MPSEAPDIVKLSERILLEVERAVADFPRKHRFGAGEELRRDARSVLRTASRAWRAYEGRGVVIAELAEAIDALKFSIELCQRLGAFNRFTTFEDLIRLARKVGQRCGGWQKRHPVGQSRPASVRDGSASILSARDASRGANP